jgi:hypothetical protein
VLQAEFPECFAVGADVWFLESEFSAFGVAFFGGIELTGIDADAGGLICHFSLLIEGIGAGAAGTVRR